MNVDLSCQSRIAQELANINYSYELSRILDYVLYAVIVLMLGVEIFFRPRALAKYTAWQRFKVMIPTKYGRTVIRDEDWPDLKYYRRISSFIFLALFTMLFINLAQYIFLRGLEICGK